MSKQSNRWLDPILLIGTFISIAISVGMVIIGLDNLSGLIIGLLSLIITLQIDIISRIQKTKNSFIEITGLTQVFSEETIGKVIHDIIKNYGVIKAFNFDHYYKLAEIYLDDCKIKFHELASGSVVVPCKNSQSYGVIGMQKAQKEIKVLHINSMKFWKSEFGIKYYELNKKALKRGIKITRIFALTPEEIKNSQAILKEQEEDGIQVLIINPNRVTSAFTIFDDRICIDYDVDKEHNFLLERIVIEQTQVKRKIDIFQNLIERYCKSLTEMSNILS